MPHIRLSLEHEIISRLRRRENVVQHMRIVSIFPHITPINDENICENFHEVNFKLSLEIAT
jgi:hypothetical protein